MRIFDSFMVNDELDMLECRLTEMENIDNLIHIAVEANVDHQDHPKPFHISENIDRFERWSDRLVVVKAKGLPPKTLNPDPWAREHAQREFVGKALHEHGAEPDDVVLHGDLDEIPTEVAARNVRPSGMVAFDMACYSMAVDWQHPQRWRGTVAAKVKNIGTFGAMRDARNFAPAIPAAGWHLGWLGGQEAQLRKLGAFCHPEIAERTLSGIEENWFLTEGWHVDGQKLIPVDVDRSWPRWIRERKCPESWFRPRTGPQFTEAWFSEQSCAALADLAKQTEGLDGTVVEVGSWQGCSTLALAGAVDDVVRAVDTWNGSTGEISEQIASDRDVYAEFLENTKGRNIRPYRMDWRDYIAEHDEPIRLLFLDGLHTYEEVRDQLAAFLPRMVPGGIVCGDDAHHPPIQRAVIERFPDAQVAASLWWTKV